MTQDQGNIAQVTHQAEQLRQVSQTLGEGVFQLQQLHTQIKGQWYGPASEAYCKVLNQLIQQMQDTNHQIVETAALLETSQLTAEQP